jgi:hypothetical protein
VHKFRRTHGQTRSSTSHLSGKQIPPPSSAVIRIGHRAAATSPRADALLRAVITPSADTIGNTAAATSVVTSPATTANKMPDSC